MPTLKYTLPNITCGHCKANVERELGNMDGVASVLVTVNNKYAAIEYDAPATPAIIEDLLIKIGYPPEVV